MAARPPFPKFAFFWKHYSNIPWQFQIDFLMICIMSSMFRHFHTFIQKHFGCSSFKKHILTSIHIFACCKLCQRTNYFLEIIGNLGLVTDRGESTENARTDILWKAESRGGERWSSESMKELNVKAFQMFTIPGCSVARVPPVGHRKGTAWETHV